MGVALREQKVHWVYRLGGAGPAALSIDEDIKEQFAAVSIDRWEAWPCAVPPRLVGSVPHPLTFAVRTLQFGHMSVTVEKPQVQETKGDTVAPGAEGLLSLQPDDFVFYVGGYPSSFTVSLGGPVGRMVSVHPHKLSSAPGGCPGWGGALMCATPAAPRAPPLPWLPGLH